MDKPSNFAELAAGLIDIVSLGIPFIFAITLVVIIWKIIDGWIINAGDDSKISEGKQTVVVGIIVLVIMSGLWGILELLKNALFGS